MHQRIVTGLSALLLISLSLVTVRAYGAKTAPVAVASQAIGADERAAVVQRINQMLEQAYVYREVAEIPTGAAVNPITGTNWEGVGVTPHVQASADEAFEVALERAHEAAQAYRAGHQQEESTRCSDAIFSLPHSHPSRPPRRFRQIAPPPIPHSRTWSSNARSAWPHPREPWNWS